MPALLVDMFDDRDVNRIIVQTFTSFAEVAKLTCVPVSTDSILSKTETVLDDFFKRVDKFFHSFNLEKPHALTFHMLNHYTWSIRRFGTVVRTSTELAVELPHKDTKDAAKRVNKRDVLEEAAFRYIVAKDAMIKHFMFLATYYPETVSSESWGPALDALLQRIDSIRDCGFPCVPTTPAHFKATAAFSNGPMPEDNGFGSIIDDDMDCNEEEIEPPKPGDEFDPWRCELAEWIKNVATIQATNSAADQGIKVKPKTKVGARVMQWAVKLRHDKDARLTSIPLAPPAALPAASSTFRVTVWPGIVPVRTLGEITLRHPVQKYRYRTRGVQLDDFERDFPKVKGLRRVLSNYALQNWVTPYVS